MPDRPGGEARLTLGGALQQATTKLRAAGVDGAGDDARRLLAAVLGLSAAQVLGWPERQLASDQADTLARSVARRAAREPVSRILGEREFYGRRFAISAATLDPRADSETLVEMALGLIHEEGWAAKPLRILDVGTGSGCLLLSLLAEVPQAMGVGTDRSLAALRIARQNARALGLDRRTRWVAADMLEGVSGEFDILICNPPYIPTAEIRHLEPEVREFDPMAALDGGSDGLLYYRRLARIASDVVPEGWLVLEVGHDQADAVTGILLEAGAPAAGVKIRCDAAGRRRCVAARARN